MEIRKENCGNFNARDFEEDRFFSVLVQGIPRTRTKKMCQI